MRNESVPDNSESSRDYRGVHRKNYFEKYRERGTGFEIIVRKSPDNTPNKIFKFCLDQITNIGIDLHNGDFAFCVFDVDYNSEDSLNNVLANARKKGVNIILSNPCFEIFFLLHFTDKISHLSTPRETKDEMNLYVENYCETKQYWNKLLPMKAIALNRSRSFEFEDHINLDTLPNGSNVYSFIDILEQLKSRPHLS